MDSVKDSIKDMRGLDRNDVLNALGLQPRRSPAEVVAPLLGVFGAGMLIGAGLGLLLAPKPGAKLRRELGRKVADVRERAVEAIDEARS